MGYGLRLRDANGNITLDTADRITREISVFSTGTSAGSVYVDTPGDVWFAIVDLPSLSNGAQAAPPVVELNGKTLSWSWPTTTYGVRAVTVVYGVY